MYVFYFILVIEIHGAYSLHVSADKLHILPYKTYHIQWHWRFTSGTADTNKILVKKNSKTCSIGIGSIGNSRKYAYIVFQTEW